MLSEYQTQNTLNPKLWVGVTLKPKLHESFMKIANHFYDFLEVNAPMLDVIIIGSNANYNLYWVFGRFPAELGPETRSNGLKL